MNKNTRDKAGLPPLIKVAVVDDHSLFRTGLIALLNDYDELRIVLEAGDGHALFEQLRRTMPHVILLDIEMPGMNGIDTLRHLREKFPAIKVIIVTMHSGEEYIFELISKGAHGFITKDKTVDVVVDAIYSVMEAGRYYTDDIASALASGSQGLFKSMNFPSWELTVKEIDVLKLVCRQKTNKEIASALGIGIRTVETHRHSIHHKTGTKNTAGLVVYALKHKLVSVAELS